MDFPCCVPNMLDIPCVHGDDANAIYKNLEREVAGIKLDVLFLNHEANIKIKCNKKSTIIRELGNQCYTNKNYKECLRLYSRSLHYAIYNTDCYGMALANRATILFELKNYKSCLKDIDLCLRSTYPVNLRPDVFIRKAKCFQNMGNATKAKETLINTLNFIDEEEVLLKEKADEYRKLIQDMMAVKVEKVEEANDSVQCNTVPLPSIDENPLFCNASSLIRLNFNEEFGRHVIAEKDIKQGEALFVEETDLFTPYRFGLKINKTHCHFCMTKLENSIPCKTCVRSSYCSEKCRDEAAKGHHKWECSAFQSKMFLMPLGHIAFRALLKTIDFGLFKTTDITTANISEFQKENHNYPLFFTIPYDIHKTTPHLLRNFSTFALILTQYLKRKTNFFDWLINKPTCADKNLTELVDKVGELIIKYCVQFRKHFHCMNVFTFNPENVTLEKFEKGFAICPSAITMRHSCAPNVIYYFAKNAIVVKALRDIKKDEEIQCARLFDIPKLECQGRHEHLEALFDIHNCKCLACEDPKMGVDTLNSYICIKCKGRALARNNTRYKHFECLDCKQCFCLPHNNAIAESLLLNYFIDPHKTDLVQAEHALETCNSLYGPYHINLQKTYHILMKYHFNVAGDDCNLKLAIVYLKEEIKILQRRSNYTEQISLMYSGCRAILSYLQPRLVPLDVDSIRISIETIQTLLKDLKVILNLLYPPLIKEIFPLIDKCVRECKRKCENILKTLK